MTMTAEGPLIQHDEYCEPGCDGRIIDLMFNETARCRCSCHRKVADAAAVFTAEAADLLAKIDAYQPSIFRRRHPDGEWYGSPNAYDLDARRGTRAATLALLVETGVVESKAIPGTGTYYRRALS